MKSQGFFSELKRRNVYKVAVAYAVVGWLLIQIATQVFPFFEIPSWGVRFVVMLIVVGFPIALIIAWAFELTPEGIKRTKDVAPNESSTRQKGRKLTAVIVVVAVIAAALFALQLFQHRGASSRTVQAVAAEENHGRRSAALLPIPEKSVAVLPFENLSSDKENAFFAQGIQDEIITTTRNKLSPRSPRPLRNATGSPLNLGSIRYSTRCGTIHDSKNSLFKLCRLIRSDAADALNE